MDKTFARECVVIFLAIIGSGLVLGAISRHFQTHSPSYAVNAEKRCVVNAITLSIAPPPDNITRAYDLNRPAK